MSEWYTPDDPTPREQCPCCDYISLPERGKYIICRVCFWEDEGLDVDEMDQPSAANNGLTLREARANFDEFGAFEEEWVKNVCSDEERAQFVRRPRRLGEGRAEEA